MGEIRKRRNRYQVRYYVGGVRHEESAKTKQAAIDLLKLREGDTVHGLPVSAKLNRFRFDDAAKDVILEYRTNGRRSVDELERRIAKHLRPFFGGRRMAAITTSVIREYIAHRQAATTVVHAEHDRKMPDGSVRRIKARTRPIAGVSNAEINRELQVLKRMFSLAMQADKVVRRPHIPLLEERNTRTGFFEIEDLHDVLAHLPTALRAPLTFAYITGWRIPSEVLALEWHQVDFRRGEIRLDPETTKNRDGRTFPMTDELRSLLLAQDEERKRLAKGGHIVPWVFVRLVAKGRRGPLEPRRIKAFAKAWNVACRLAGCPGRIPHDFRRSAIRNMIRRGIPERIAMQLAGHKTRSVFDRYNVVSPGDLRTAATQLHALIGSKKGPGASSSNA